MATASSGTGEEAAEVAVGRRRLGGVDPDSDHRSRGFEGNNQFAANSRNLVTVREFRATIKCAASGRTDASRRGAASDFRSGLGKDRQGAGRTRSGIQTRTLSPTRWNSFRSE